MTDDQKIAQALVLRSEHPDWGYDRLAAAAGLSKGKVRHALMRSKLEQAKSLITGRALVSIEAEPTDLNGFRERITAALTRAQNSYIECGRLLTRAKEILGHGQFGLLFSGENPLPISISTADRLMKIANDERITRIVNSAHAPILPAWTTTYELTKLDDATLGKVFDSGLITPDLQRSDVKRMAKQRRTETARAAYASRVTEGCRVDDLHALAVSGYRAGVIMIDCPWKFAVRSDKGDDRSPEYDRMTVDDLCALPIRELGAENSVLMPWVLRWLPYEVLQRLFGAWGYTHVSRAFVWAKQNASGLGWHMGMGYGTRANPEDCLLCTRGNPERLDAGVNELIVSRIGEHSEKPDEAYANAERLFAGPYLEIFGRKLRPNWTVWGNEIPRESWPVVDHPEAAE